MLVLINRKREVSTIILGVGILVNYFKYIKGILFGVLCIAGFYLFQNVGMLFFLGVTGNFDRKFFESMHTKHITHFTANENGLLILAGDLVVIIAILIIFAVKKNISIRGTLKLKGFAPKKLFVVVPLAIGTAICSSMIAQIVCRIVGVNPAHTIKFFSDMNSIYAYIALIIVGPIAEEFLFRGILFNYLDRKTTRIYAVILSSIFFGIAHGDLVQGVAVFFSGIAMALMYVYTDSILGDITVHMINNFIATFFGLFILYISHSVGAPTGGFISIAVLVISPALILIATRIYKRQIHRPTKQFRKTIVILCVLFAINIGLGIGYIFIPMPNHTVQHTQIK